MGIIKDNLDETIKTVDEMKTAYTGNALVQAQLKIMKTHLMCAKRILNKIEGFRNSCNEKTR